VKQHAVRIALALVACGSLALAQDAAKSKAETMTALKHALEAQARMKKAQRAGDQGEVDSQWGIMDQQFRNVVIGMNELAEAPDKKTWKLLCKVAEKVPDEFGPDEPILKAATTATDAGVQADIKKRALKFKSPKIRRALVLQLARQKEWGALLKAIKDKDEGVASLAAWKLMDNKVESAVVPLLDQLEKLERSRSGIWDVLHHGMGKLLGKKCNSAIEYRSLWEIVQGQGGLASVHPEEEKAAAPGELSSGVRLFGREIDCTRIVFILDVSGSMQQIDPNQQTAGAGAEPRGT
jgi:hypothetical protein